ncbi:hypothetical protein CC1G_06327 [Coprinopsis cinerea okayama7|uniref:Mediator of RNA polymerase II transcription subunit 19 n=1 Tax=Coprinopsis cinerea (strain Okayama-7 / 130 / ATCC MYA-4618 / FGSC 9003) TaxID=240176 RepID=A8NTJ1_COPC7|nr:hypothetical protein CC1G_06327 [Coprinopsis cinerea okayama7\|eukprot:XP_001836242.2 hypothetical protein CC1G_06327 [Coprinopsis cinerea okayama7\
MFDTPVPPPPKLHLECTQDLLARFNLHSAYDRYVRPAVLPGNETGVGAGGPQTPGSKGKGKEVDVNMAEGGMNTGLGGGHPHGGAGEADDDDGPGGKGEKKKKNSYKHLIKGLPGKHSMKKDDYLTTIMLIPPKQRIPITPFDVHTQEDAFAVSPEGLKGWNIHALVLESAQAREDRKKKKELKRLAKLQQQQIQQGLPVTQPSLQAPVPTPAAARPQGVGTPQRNPSGTRTTSGGTPRPASTVPRPGSTPVRVSTPNTQAQQATAGTPRSTVPRPGSTVPRPGSTVPPPGAGLPPRPASTKPQVAPPGSGFSGGEPRGKKRAHEEGAVNAVQTNGSQGHGISNGVPNGNGTPQPRPVINAKAGNAGVRPRPVKKPRMDLPGQSNPNIQQQPTPQGV